jgi:hypothetical protein
MEVDAFLKLWVHAGALYVAACAPSPLLCPPQVVRENRP